GHRPSIVLPPSHLLCTFLLCRVALYRHPHPRAHVARVLNGPWPQTSPHVVPSHGHGLYVPWRAHYTLPCSWWSNTARGAVQSNDLESDVLDRPSALLLYCTYVQ